MKLRAPARLLLRALHAAGEFGCAILAASHVLFCPVCESASGIEVPSSCAPQGRKIPPGLRCGVEVAPCPARRWVRNPG